MENINAKCKLCGFEFGNFPVEEIGTLKWLLATARWVKNSTDHLRQAHGVRDETLEALSASANKTLSRLN